VAVAAAACSTERGAPGPVEGASTAVARVDGDEITLADVDERIRRRLFEEEFGGDPDRLYSARRATLDEMIDEQLLAEAAAEAGQPPERFLDARLAELPPITEADMQALFDANRDRLPADATMEPYREQLRAHLERERTDEVLAALRESTPIEISMPRDRITVDALGPSLGPADAPVTVVEFSDFQCPFCSRAVPVMKALHARYPDDVRIVYRHLPLSFHAQAREAAIAAVCADDQGHFWDYHDLLFENQEDLEREAFVAHAEALDLDLDRFEACLDSDDAAATVDADLRAAEAAGATGTPTFYINGIKLTGARPLEQFEEIVEEERDRLVP
jgi:protein-disulfide isomerase